MERKVELERKERFMTPYKIPEEKVERAIDEAIKKLEKNVSKYWSTFSKTSSVNFLYPQGKMIIGYAAWKREFSGWHMS